MASVKRVAYASVDNSRCGLGGQPDRNATGRALSTRRGLSWPPMMTGTSPPDLSTRLEQYAGAKRRGVEWLLRQTHADGSIGDPAHGFRFYRVPWTFTVAGETAAATALCGWIRRHMFTPEGDFDRGRRVLTDAYAYRNATLVYGAHMARQFDLSSRGLEFVLTMQDPQSGGFTNDVEADGTPGDVMDIPYACGCGLACIALGRLDAARAVHAFLERIWRSQRELPDRLHYAWSRERQALVTGGADEPSWFTVEAQAARKQRWTVGGIAAAFLCRLHMVDQRSNYASLARDYMAFSMQCTPRQFDYAQVCKSGWGAALLYQLTGDAECGAWAARVGDWFVETQQADGSWSWDQNATLGETIELTAEFAAHVDTIIGCLASRA